MLGWMRPKPESRLPGKISITTDMQMTPALWQKVKVKVAQSRPTLCDPMDCTVHGILQARILEWVAFSFSRGSSNPGIRPRSPTLQADSLPVELQGKPKNTATGSLSILQQIFLTRESNWGLLDCRQILYQLSYEGSPRKGRKWRGPKEPLMKVREESEKADLKLSI